MRSQRRADHTGTSGLALSVQNISLRDRCRMLAKPLLALVNPWTCGQAHRHSLAISSPRCNGREASRRGPSISNLPLSLCAASINCRTATARLVNKAPDTTRDECIKSAGTKTRHSLQRISPIGSGHVLSESSLEACPSSALLSIMVMLSLTDVSAASPMIQSARQRPYE